MKKTTQIFGMCSLMVLLAACSGGGATSGGVSDEKSSSDALIQFLPYEVVRNNLITALEINSSGDAIELLDDNAQVFGALVNNSRNLGFTVTRARVWANVSDLACNEALTDHPSLLFPVSPLDPDTIFRRVIGRPIKDSERDAFDSLMGVEGYNTTVERQHAICVATLNYLPAQMQ